MTQNLTSSNSEVGLCAFELTLGLGHGHLLYLASREGKNTWRSPTPKGRELYRAYINQYVGPVSCTFTLVYRDHLIFNGRGLVVDFLPKSLN